MKLNIFRVKSNWFYELEYRGVRIVKLIDLEKEYKSSAYHSLHEGEISKIVYKKLPKELKQHYRKVYMQIIYTIKKIREMDKFRIVSKGGMHYYLRFPKKLNFERIDILYDPLDGGYLYIKPGKEYEVKKKQYYNEVKLPKRIVKDLKLTKSAYTPKVEVVENERGRYWKLIIF